MSKAHLPPVPPANRTTKGPEGQGPAANAASGATQDAKPGRTTHPEQQGQQGNTHQNTTHQGLQQDR